MGRSLGIGCWCGGRGGFGFAAEEPLFQSADFALEELDLLLEIIFALAGALMECSPIVGLEAEFNELTAEMAEE